MHTLRDTHHTQNDIFYYCTAYSSMNKKWLFWFSLATGFITLGVGSGIFMLWWVARAWFAIDFSKLEGYGFLWIFIAIPLALTGLITSSFVISANSGKQSKISAIPLLLILLNIPTVFVVINLQANISERVYFKVFNESGQEFKNVRLTSNSFNLNLGTLDNQCSIVDFYLPTYIGADYESVPAIEEVTLELSTGTDEHLLQMPYSMKGWCQRIVVTDSLTLTSRWILK